MKEPKVSHDPVTRPPDATADDLQSVFESLWSQRFTGKIVFHFRSGYPSVIDIKGPSRRRVLIRPLTPR